MFFARRATVAAAAECRMLFELILIKCRWLLAASTWNRLTVDSLLGVGKCAVGCCADVLCAWSQNYERLRYIFICMFVVPEAMICMILNSLNAIMVIHRNDVRNDGWIVGDWTINPIGDVGWCVLCLYSCCFFAYFFIYLFLSLTSIANGNLTRWN